MFDKIVNPYLKGEKIIINDIKEEDKIEYYNLYIDDNLNKFWGYDYREDCINPDPDYFFKFVKEMKKNKEEYTLIVRAEDKFVGDIVIHEFTKNSVEIGFRILPLYQSKGYAYDAIKTIIKYIKEELNPEYIKAKCFKENIKSYNLLIKSGFNKYNEDDKYFYLKIDNDI